MLHPTVVVYHKNCADGLVSAWVASLVNPGIVALPLGAHDRLTPDQMMALRGQDVLVVDVVPFHVECLRWLAHNTRMVMFLDHHASSQERLAIAFPNRPYNVVWLVDTSPMTCGAHMAWAHLMSGTVGPPSWIVDVVWKHDTWTFQSDMDRRMAFFLTETIFRVFNRPGAEHELFHELSMRHPYPYFFPAHEADTLGRKYEQMMEQCRVLASNATVVQSPDMGCVHVLRACDRAIVRKPLSAATVMRWSSWVRDALDSAAVLIVFRLVRDPVDGGVVVSGCVRGHGALKFARAAGNHSCGGHEKAAGFRGDVYVFTNVLGMRLDDNAILSAIDNGDNG